MQIHLPASFRHCNPVLRQLGITLALITPLAAQSTANVSITLDSTQLRRTIPNDFLGLSLEMSSIMAANNNGVAWLSGNPTAYSAMVQTIGVKNIRIGGNSSERQPYASTTDAANVDAFANLIGANLIWTVPVKQFYNQSSSISFVRSMYNDQHVNHSYSFPTNIEIGNEADNSENLPAAPSANPHGSRATMASAAPFAPRSTAEFSPPDPPRRAAVLIPQR